MNPLDEIVRNSSALFLDFDGPVCQVFAGLSPSVVASDLRAYLTDQGVEPPARSDSHPIGLLAWVGEHHPRLSRAVDDQLRAAEVCAIDSALPTPHAVDVMTSANRCGMVVAIVSNNAGEAIERYLALYDLADHVTLVVGRVGGDPMLLKPHPHPVQRAVAKIGTRPADCVLVGDSVTDIQASQSAGVHSIGYAKTPNRRPALVAAGAEAIVDSMGELAARLDSAA